MAVAPLLRHSSILGLLATLRHAPLAAPPATRASRRLLLVATDPTVDVATAAADAAAAADDERWMARALDEAERAFTAGEVPIGAVLVRGGTLISAAHNRVEATRDASAHAEMLCMRAAAAADTTWRLNARGTATLYCTVEPCPMCLAALHLFRIDRLVYGATNPRLGAVESDMRSDAAAPHPYHALHTTGGVRADEAAALMRRFFKRRRTLRARGARALCAPRECCRSHTRYASASWRAQETSRGTAMRAARAMLAMLATCSSSSRDGQTVSPVSALPCCCKI